VKGASMTVYHIFITLSEKIGGNYYYAEINQQIGRIKKIVEEYNSGKKFLFCGVVFSASKIMSVRIFKSETSVNDVVLPNGKKIRDEEIKLIRDYLSNGLVEGINKALDDFDIIPPQEESTAKSEQRMEIGTKTEVFIVHGRDDKQALLLQNHLRDDLNIRAKIFEDFKKKAGSTTIIEQLQYIWKNAGYALIVATPDDFGILRQEFEEKTNALLRAKNKIEAEKVCKLLEDLKTRARQNVVFEFGLFMGALGRENVCCLLQDSTQERPSDIGGVLYAEFNKSVDERFGEIDAKLKEWLAKTT
jgi:predicted nucleotide-binding protein